MPNDQKTVKTDDSQTLKSNVPPILIQEDVLPPMPQENVSTKQDAVNSSPVDSGSGAPENDIKIDTVMPAVVTTGPKKKFAGGKVIATILGLFLLVGGVGAGVFLTGQNQNVSEKAYTPGDTGNIGVDTCGFIEATSTDGSSCPRLSNNSGNNNVSSYTTTYTLKNVTANTHTVQYVKRSNYCSEPYALFNSGTNDYWCPNGMVDVPEEVELSAGQTITIPVTRSSDSGLSCGSYQTDLIVNSIDNRTECHGVTSNLVGWGLCQTGTTCPSQCSTKPFVSGTVTAKTDGNTTVKCTFSEKVDCIAPTVNGQGSACTFTGWEGNTGVYDCNVAYTDVTSVSCNTFPGSASNCCAGGNAVTKPPVDRPSPSPIADTAVCQNIKAYNSAWVELTSAQLSGLKTSNIVNFCVTGSASSGSFDKAKFTINGVEQAETTTKRPGGEDFCQSYTIPANTTTFGITAQINHVKLGWK